ncbi:MAG: primosomal protein N', partial [Defluviitaleaceae bacterium]|nr:primosomal protein N' [Defluviitaleaceae bacterium]
IEVFAQRLGAAVTFTHSRLSLGERYDQWKRARDGQVSVMLGPRSAIFTPFANLGAIIVDEEHENTYKSETSPKYHTVDIAKKLGELTGALVLLGSATPDVATYHAAMDGAYQLISLPQRVNKTQNLVEIADMRRELAEGNRTIFSKALFDAITDNLAANRQSILFLNRRGHSTFVCCRACGHTMACTNCNVNLTFHIYTNKLVCHYCAMQMANPDNCPVCGSRHIKHFGIGTQRVMEDISQFFPSARAIRMDMDTTGRKDSHESIISAFSRGEADILVGTQMIAKGLNFPQVSLVGIMAADMAIHGGDYRSAEVAYQLITQVSGRAGRADLPGRAIIQTYNPDHYAIAHATESDYLRFYAEEIEFRRQMFYPPFSHVVSIICKSPDERGLIALLHRLSDIMHAANRKNLCHILGPAPCIISKIRNQYRWKILAKSADETILRQFALHCLNKLTKSQDTSKININMTMDPKNIP